MSNSSGLPRKELIRNDSLLDDQIIIIESTSSVAASVIPTQSLSQIVSLAPAGSQHPSPLEVGISDSEIQTIADLRKSRIHTIEADILQTKHHHNAKFLAYPKPARFRRFFGGGNHRTCQSISSIWIVSGYQGGALLSTYVLGTCSAIGGSCRYPSILLRGPGGSVGGFGICGSSGSGCPYWI